MSNSRNFLCSLRCQWGNSPGRVRRRPCSPPRCLEMVFPFPFVNEMLPIFGPVGESHHPENLLWIGFAPREMTNSRSYPPRVRFREIVVMKFVGHPVSYAIKKKEQMGESCSQRGVRDMCSRVSPSTETPRPHQAAAGTGISFRLRTRLWAAAGKAKIHVILNSRQCFSLCSKAMSSSQPEHPSMRFSLLLTGGIAGVSRSARIDGAATWSARVLRHVPSDVHGTAFGNELCRVEALATTYRDAPVARNLFAAHRIQHLQ